MSNVINQIRAWHHAARPAPTQRDFDVQLGCHFEEIVEMLECLHFTHPKFGTSAGGDVTLLTLLHEFADELKAGNLKVQVVDRRGLLDSLCDQIVTAVGVAHCAGVRIEEALVEVDRSNWSKFVDGQPLRDANGKIKKGPHYTPPNLEGMY